MGKQLALHRVFDHKSLTGSRVPEGYNGLIAGGLQSVAQMCDDCLHLVLSGQTPKHREPCGFGDLNAKDAGVVIWVHSGVIRTPEQLVEFLTEEHPTVKAYVLFTHGGERGVGYHSAPQLTRSGVPILSLSTPTCLLASPPSPFSKAVLALETRLEGVLREQWLEPERWRDAPDAIRQFNICEPTYFDDAFELKLLVDYTGSEGFEWNDAWTGCLNVLLRRKSLRRFASAQWTARDPAGDIRGRLRSVTEPWLAEVSQGRRADAVKRWFSDRGASCVATVLGPPSWDEWCRHYCEQGKT